MASVTSASRWVKEDLSEHLSASLIERLCQELGHSWRRRVLGPVATVWLLVEQVMAGNVACTAVRHLSGVDLSAWAYCQARSRLPVELMRRLMRAVCDGLRAAEGPEGLWRGHRTYRIDGTGLSMPDSPALADRDRPAAPEDHDGAGRAAV